MNSLVSIFPLSAGRKLAMHPKLTKTLAIDSALLRLRTANKAELRTFLNGAQGAWTSARPDAISGKTNFILWLRLLIGESAAMHLWVPSVFILRLRQLERGDLVIRDRRGDVMLPPYAGMPREFAQVCNFLGFNLTHFVPTWDGGYTNCRDASDADADQFVRRLCAVWIAKPKEMDGDELAAWCFKSLRDAGFHVERP